jgi:hypothetical protein
MTEFDRAEIAEYLVSCGWQFAGSLSGGPGWVRYLNLWDLDIPDVPMSQRMIPVGVAIPDMLDKTLTEWLDCLRKAFDRDYVGGCPWYLPHILPVTITPIIERFGNPAPSDTINQPQETP